MRGLRAFAHKWAGEVAGYATIITLLGIIVGLVWKIVEGPVYANVTAVDSKHDQVEAAMRSTMEAEGREIHEIDANVRALMRANGIKPTTQAADPPQSGPP